MQLPEAKTPLLRDALVDLREKAPEWAHSIIFAGLRGSDAHGTKLPLDHPRGTDDTDTFAVCVQRTNFYLGLQGCGKARQHWDTAGDRYDHLVYDVRKFIRLLLKGNPSDLPEEPDRVAASRILLGILHAHELTGWL